MSVIRKLLIQGVRSFDPQNQDIIEFYTPLTIIVGQNGCGKTTVIECLKYITTGELPPNSKGGAFIHDPKLAGENEVKAQVKLRFYNISQRSMTCVRSMLLTQKKATVAQKTLEGVLSFDATSSEEKVSISSRCSDLDAMMPEQLGVSKAVLDNVIFCHQEESNWPLSEASVLKKKFDEIFAATRYTKALESIKTIRKNQTTEIRVQRTELKHLEDKRSKSERVKAEYEKSTMSVHGFKTRIAELQKQEEQTVSQIEALTVRMQELMGLQTIVEGLKMNLSQKVASYREMAANTNILGLTDDELQSLSLDIASKINSQDSAVHAKQEQRDSLRKQIDDLNMQLRQVSEEKNRLVSAQQNLQIKISGRATVVSEISLSFELVIEGMQDKSEEKAAECVTMLNKLVADIEGERKDLSSQAHKTETDLQSEIDKVQSRISEHNVTMATCSKQVAVNTQEIRNLQQKHDSLKVDDSMMQNIAKEMETENELLAKAQAQGNDAALGNIAKQKRIELVSTGEEISNLQTEITRNNQQADTRAKLALARKELENNEARSKELLSDPGYAAYQPDADPLGGVENKRFSMISQSISRKKQSVADLNDKAKQCHNDLSSTRVRLDMAKQSFMQQFEEMGSKSKRISSACGTDSFDDVYADAQTELNELIEMAGHYKSASSMYKAYIQKIESDHACPVCSRGWSNKGDEEKLVSKLKLDFTSAPTELLRIDSEIRTSERRLEELGGMRSIVRDVKEWEGHGKADLEKQIAELTAKVDNLSVQADDVDMEATMLSTDIDSLTELLAKSKELVALEEKSQRAKLQIESYQNELLITGSTKTIEELQSEVAELQSKEILLRRELERMDQEGFRKQREIGLRRDNIRRLQETQDKYNMQVKERGSLLKRIAELEANSETNKAERQSAQELASGLLPQLQESQKRLADFRVETKQRESTIDKRLRDLMQSRDRLTMLSKEVEDTRSLLACPPGETEYPDRLAMTNAQIEKLLEQDSGLKSDLEKVVHELLESDRTADKLGAQQREVSDNIRLRANLNEQGKLKEELQVASEKQARLERDFSEIYKDDDEHEESQVLAPDSDNEENMEVDEDMQLDSGSRKRQRGNSGERSGQGAGQRYAGKRLQRRREALNSQLSQLTSERAGLQGEVKQLEDQAKRLKQELATDYKNIDQLYVRQLVQCKTEELANTDLETYSKALDAAIMRYHSLKMQDINKIIRELWINTYQGSDIDTIEIRSEVEGARNSRSHNYRVVMIKGGHAIDMRGRCSAGQKVLACLIIRLALAETFSTNCGILALDEPTTNLDQENIDSLARSLARIIKSRQEQRNFQLIVITHDEIFMQLLGKSEYADYYWRVYKDENQCSVFARRPIASN
ncbi:DNA repair protein rad50 [Coemansia sp. RSA 485]|nr:DNA repair protein rad50 [Coemansia sp. RSA 485]KAJ2602377.1 DNA repair protein rad50 [Coemansia sp. RSA 1721]